MSARSIVAGGGPPSFTIANPSPADDGHSMVYNAASSSFTPAVPAQAGYAPNAGVVYRGVAAFVEVGGTGTFAPGNYTAIVTTSNSANTSTVVFRFFGAPTATVLSGTPIQFQCDLPAALTSGPYATLAGSAVFTQGTTHILYASIFGTQLTLASSVAFAPGAAQMGAFTLVWVSDPATLDYVPEPMGSLFHADAYQGRELQASAVSELDEVPIDLSEPDEVPIDPADRTRAWVESPISGEVSDFGSDFSFAGLE